MELSTGRNIGRAKSDDSQEIQHHQSACSCDNGNRFLLSLTSKHSKYEYVLLDYF